MNENDEDVKPSSSYEEEIDPAILELIGKIQSKRDEFGELDGRVDALTRELEVRVTKFLNSSTKIFTSVELTSRIVESLNMLYKTQMDLKDKTLRSYEKEIDLRKKMPKEDGGSGEDLYDDVLKAVEKARQLKIQKQKEAEEVDDHE